MWSRSNMLRLLRPAVRLSPAPLAPPLHVHVPALSVHTPVNVAEQFLVGFQELSGASWWFSIAAATLTVRSTVTLPLAAYQTVIIHRVASLQKEISELSQRLRYEVSVRARQQGWNERTCRFQFKKNMRRIVSELYVRDNCHPFKASTLVLVQVPVWISLSLALRELSLDSSEVYSALTTGGALWFKDLTVPDSTWIIPVSLGLTNLLLVELASLQQRPVPSRFQKVLLHVFRAVSLFMIPVSAYVPTSMSLYWLVSSLVGLGHNMILRSNTVQTLIGVPTKSSTPYRDIYTAFVSKYVSRPRTGTGSGSGSEPH